MGSQTAMAQLLDMPLLCLAIRTQKKAEIVAVAGGNSLSLPRHPGKIQGQLGFLFQVEKDYTWAYNFTWPLPVAGSELGSQCLTHGTGGWSGPAPREEEPGQPD